jgi:AcrR family transcriptional regulator
LNKHTDTDKKAKIIDAAYKVLSEQGYDKASMKEIAREAGVAQGLINYYFPAKEGLLFELFHQETCRYCAEMEKVSELPLTPEWVQEAMKLHMNLVEEHPEWQRLRFELFAIGLRSDTGSEEIALSLRQARDQAVRAMDRLPIGGGARLDALAGVIVAALDGLSLQQMSDPEFDAAAAYATLADMLEHYLGTTK